MDNARRILIVDDEPQLTRVLRTGLKARGYDVNIAPDGVTALRVFADWSPHLVVLDLAMPRMDGLELCSRLRATSQVPIIVLSAKGEEKVKVQALDSGADDYVTKPFGMNELLARVRVALRRMPPNEEPSAVIETGDFRVDPEAHIITLRNAELQLTPKEYELLLHFIRNAGKILTHRTLLTAIWGGSYTEQNEYLRVFVGHLRRKIEADPSKPRYILTEPWTGYRFNPSGKQI